MIDIDAFGEWYADKFGSKKNKILSEADQKRHDKIVEWLSTHVPRIDTVEVDGARVPIETVEIYGLEIGVDANGNAACVSSQWGFVLEDEA